MDSVLIGVLAVLGFLIVGGMVYIALRENRDYDPLQERLRQYGDREVPVTLEEAEMSLGFKDRVILPIINWLSRVIGRLTPQRQLESTRKKLEQAGMTTDPTRFYLMSVVLGIIFLVLGFIIFVQMRLVASIQGAPAVGAALATGWLGFYFPMLSVNRRIRRRQDSIVKSLPDALDLLVICVEAGLGFDMAMGKVYDKWENDLSVAFGRVLREIQLGKTRRDALRDMAERFDVPDLNSFTAAVIQADQLGVSMSKILRVQSDQMRVKRRQRAQEKAHQAPVKMMVPMVFLIFPSIWIVLLGPAILRVMEVSGSTTAF
jgi:tight adherence protein C